MKGNTPRFPPKSTYSNINSSSEQHSNLSQSSLDSAQDIQTFSSSESSNNFSETEFPSSKSSAPQSNSSNLTNITNTTNNESPTQNPQQINHSLPPHYVKTNNSNTTNYSLKHPASDNILLKHSQPSPTTSKFIILSIPHHTHPTTINNSLNTSLGNIIKYKELKRFFDKHNN